MENQREGEEREAEANRNKKRNITNNKIFPFIKNNGSFKLFKYLLLDEIPFKDITNLLLWDYDVKSPSLVLKELGK